MLRICWNSAYIIFQIYRFQFKCQKNMKYLPPVRPKLVPNWKCSEFGTSDVSNTPIFILMSNVITKYFYQLSVFIKFQ